MAGVASVAVLMGSKSDWETMRHCAELLGRLGVSFEARVVSAHRTPELLAAFAKEAETRDLQVIIAGAGGAAHLPGMLAAYTRLPVIGVPIQSRALQGLDSLLSIVQMPAGVPVLTMSIGESGARNAALAAASILSLKDEEIRKQLVSFRETQTEQVLAIHLENSHYQENDSPKSQRC
jgi:5-(carboxyamino)imidazole ribonucleotide mutase